MVTMDQNSVTASKYPKYTIVLGNTISSITAAELTSAIESSKASAAAAKQSEINAKQSELNAKDSENEAEISAASSQQSATQSASSATASANSAKAAKTSETNAKASETAAKTSETNSKASETAAKTSETNANSSKTAAAASASAAKTSETNAAASASAAKTSETNANSSKTAAANSASAAKTSETNAKISETNAAASATKAENAASGMRDSIGLGNAPRNCPDISGNPSAYIGFMRIMSTAVGFPSIASGESSLTGFISQVDGSPAYTGVFQGWASRSLYTYRWASNIGPQWTRHARKNEVDKLVQLSSETQLLNPNEGAKIIITSSKLWGAYDIENRAYIPLAVEQGGTGGRSAAEARTNLQLNRFQRPSDTRTMILSTDVQNDGCYLQIDADGRWGAYNPKTASWQPLAIAQGGTGGLSISEAKTNLQIPSVGAGDWIDIAAPAGVEAGKYYPIVINAQRAGLYLSGFFIDIQTRSSSGGDPMNCCTFNGFIRTGGWSDRKDAGYGYYNRYEPNELALKCILVSGKNFEYNIAVYVEGRAFPVKMRIPQFCTATAVASASTYGKVTFAWGTPNPATDSVGVTTLFDFSLNRAGFYQAAAPTGNYYIGNGERIVLSNGMSVEDELSLQAPKISFSGTIKAGNGVIADGDLVVGGAGVLNGNLGVGGGATSKMPSPDKGIVIGSGSIVREDGEGRVILSASGGADRRVQLRPAGATAVNNQVEISCTSATEGDTKISFGQGAAIRCNRTGSSIISSKAGQMIYLRPNGDEVWEGQVTIADNGKMVVNGDLETSGSIKSNGNLETSGSIKSNASFVAEGVDPSGFTYRSTFLDGATTRNAEFRAASSGGEIVIRDPSGGTDHKFFGFGYDGSLSLSGAIRPGSPIDISYGGTGATDAEGIKNNIGLGRNHSPTFSGITMESTWPAVTLKTSQVDDSRIGRRISFENDGSTALNVFFANGNNSTGRNIVTIPRPNSTRRMYVSFDGGLSPNGNSNIAGIVSRDLDIVPQGWQSVSGSYLHSPYSGNAYGSLFTQSTGGLSQGDTTSQGVFGRWNQQRFYDTSNRIYTRVQTNAYSWGAWVQVTTSAVSDERAKDILGNLDVECALSNIDRMEFKLFKFKEEHHTKEIRGATRRGVISQQIKQIDREYVKDVGGYWHLDQTPMLLDGLAAIQALSHRDRENKERITALESEVSDLKKQIADLTQVVNSLLANKG